MRVLGVIINIFLPGLGTMIVGKIITGIVQLLLWGLGVIFSLTGVGIIIGGPLSFIVWVWAIVSAATAKEKPVEVIVRQSAEE